jgi:ABC-type branched-subunit amino acid transport system ATPase component
MLRLENITKHFGGVAAIRGSDFTVPANQTTALIGPNGAGKTTLFDIIGGYLPADSGKVILDGEELRTLEPHERSKRGISRTFQQVRLFRYLTILDHLVMAEGDSDMRFWLNLVKPKKPAREKYEAILGEYGVERTLDTPVSDLSYGQRKLLQIAMALSRPHKLLMLDEPVAGVNSVVQERVEKLLLGLKAKGETILLIDHDMQFVRRLADQVICLDAGVVLASGTPEQVLNNPKVSEAYLGL